MIKRILDLKGEIEHKSLILLGPRQVGKSTLIQNTFPKAKTYNLMENDVFRDLVSHPELIRQSLRDSDTVIVIDEAQKIPALFDETQVILDRNPKRRVILSGSSARKLRRQQVNLLTGRVRVQHLFPLTLKELGTKRLQHAINFGGLPAVANSSQPDKDLVDYVGVYLKEEIYAESLVRSLERFSRFLNTAALCSGLQVNFTKIGNDCGISPRTIMDYFQMLQDTLIGSILEPFQKTKKRKAVSTAKFYFFDTGVNNALLNRFHNTPGTETYGVLLEQLIYLELRAWNHYLHAGQIPIHFWRTQNREVDFVINENVALEVKSKTRIHDGDLIGIRALADDSVTLKRKLVLCLEKQWRKTDDGIEIIPLDNFVNALWNNEYLAP